MGDNSTANMIWHSPGATINNKPQIIEKVERIKEVIANDISIDDATRSNAVTTLNNLVSEVNNSGAPSQSTLSNVLSIGSNISSIASLAISLYQLFVHP
ncbi:hypothetical protein J2W55_004930 [Mucilaginibacter pocheonensis]|uniref:Killing trait domain-containing protein n=1 Tax=Mucilaginibacter pocheonensis TaxID=398050 RepID=A0ABU1TI75_9SPHI|nr:hypothetical protein [Mucilaginibacter pocheonensis]